MNQFKGQTLSWELKDGVIELALHRESLQRDRFADARRVGEVRVRELERMQDDAHALILYSTLKSGFCAGADLRELYHGAQGMEKASGGTGRPGISGAHPQSDEHNRRSPRSLLSPRLNGVTFGGGFELALVCDLIIADKMARFCFPELRLGLIPGFGGIPRLKRDLGNAVVRDLLLTGRSFNATKAQQVGLVSQVVGEGESLKAARGTAAQLGKFDRRTAIAAKKFIKPIPYEELQREIDIFCDLFTQPAVEAGLKKFVESKDAQPYLP